MKFGYQVQGTDAYITAMLEADDALDETTYGMIQNNRAAFPDLLPLAVSHMDGSVVLRYKVTGKKSAKNYLEAALKKADALRLLEHIVKTVTDAEDYLIGPQQFVLDVEQLYIDGASGTPCLICLPTKKAYESPFACADFFKNLVGMIKLEDGEDLPLYKFLYTHPTFTLAEFHASLTELRVRFVDAHSGMVKQLVREETKPQRERETPPAAEPVKPVTPPKPAPADEPEAPKKKGLFAGLFGGKKEKNAESETAAPVNDIASILQSFENGEVPAAKRGNAAPARAAISNTPAKPAAAPEFVPPKAEEAPARPMGTVIEDIPAAPEHGAFLVSADDGARYAITKEKTVISRLPEIGDIVIKDDHISSQHAVILKKGDAYYLRDTDSSNHSFKNGAALKPGDDVPLNAGDEVRFWRLSFRFEIV